METANDSVDYLKESTQYLIKAASYVGKFFGTVIIQGKKINASLLEMTSQLNLDKFTSDLGGWSTQTQSIVKKLIPSGKSISSEETSAITTPIDREFYTNFGRDLIELSKANLKSDNLTIIDASKYKPQ